MDVRPALASDAAAISALLRASAPYFLDSNDSEDALRFFARTSPDAMRETIASPQREFFVAEEGGEFAGFVSVKDDCHVVQFFVAPACQGRGVGRLLWERALAAIRRRGPVPDITVHASVFAVPVYGRFGFEIAGERTTEKGLTYVPMILRASADSS